MCRRKWIPEGGSPPEIKEDFPHEKKAIRAIRCAVTDDRSDHSNSNSGRYAGRRDKKANEMNGRSNSKKSNAHSQR